MSVQKILAQAEKLLQKGKLQEAAVKLEEVLRTDPNNEVAANKLALAYKDLGELDKAVGLYCQIAKRASDIGKSNKAVALFKQALALNDSDPRVLVGLADESEQLGKYSEAKSLTVKLLDFLLPRKRYLEATEACARLVRCSPNDDIPKLQWLNILRLLSDDSRLIPALVVLCGPPGVVAADHSVGGDPTSLSGEVISKLQELMAWYPADPFLPYSLAWVCYRRQEHLRSMELLQESIRRDPDFTLSMLLYVRILIDNDRLSESQFVYSFAKDIMPKDRRTEIKILNEQVLSFEKSNGWLAISEDLSEGGEILPSDFLRLMRNESIEEDSQDTNTGIALGGKPGSYSVGAGASDLSAPVEELPEQEFEATSMIRFNEIDLSEGGSEDGSSAQPSDSQPPSNQVAPPIAPSEEVESEEVEFTTFVSTDFAGQEVVGTPGQDSDVSADQYGDQGGLKFEDIPHDDASPDREEQTKTNAGATRVYTPQEAVAATKWGKAIRTEVSAEESDGAKRAKAAIENQKRKFEEIKEATRVIQAGEAIDSESETIVASPEEIPAPPPLNPHGLTPPPPVPGEVGPSTKDSPRLDLTSFIDHPEPSSALEAGNIPVRERPKLGIFGNLTKDKEGNEVPQSLKPYPEIPSGQSIPAEFSDEDNQPTMVIRTDQLKESLATSEQAASTEKPVWDTENINIEGEAPIQIDGSQRQSTRPVDFHNYNEQEVKEEQTVEGAGNAPLTMESPFRSNASDGWDDNQATMIVKAPPGLDSAKSQSEDEWDDNQPTMLVKRPVVDSLENQLEGQAESELPPGVADWEHEQPTMIAKNPVQMETQKIPIPDGRPGVEPPAEPVEDFPIPEAEKLDGPVDFEIPQDMPSIKMQSTTEAASPLEKTQEIQKASGEKTFTLTIGPNLKDSGLELNDGVSQKQEVLEYNVPESQEKREKEIPIVKEMEVPEAGKTTIGMEGIVGEEPSSIKEFKIDDSALKAHLDAKASESLGEEADALSQAVSAMETEKPAKLPDIHAAGIVPNATILTPEEKIQKMLQEEVAESEAETEALSGGQSSSGDLVISDNARGPIALKEDNTTHFKSEVEKLKKTPKEFLELAKKYYREKKYYMARKACREAISLGGDEEIVKQLLRKIRSKENPDSIYSHFSTDDLTPPSGEMVREIISKLDAEFDLSLEEEENELRNDVRDSLVIIRPQINQILSDASVQVRMDLGVAFFEMGMFEEAEHIFENTKDEAGGLNLDALYLAAESMTQRGDYVRAVTILHKICKSPERQENQNLAVYYLLGEAYEAMNQKKRSMRYYKKAAEIDLNYRDLKLKIE